MFESEPDNPNRILGGENLRFDRVVKPSDGRGPRFPEYWVTEDWEPEYWVMEDWGMEHWATVIETAEYWGMEDWTTIIETISGMKRIAN